MLLPLHPTNVLPKFYINFLHQLVYHLPPTAVDSYSPNSPQTCSSNVHDYNLFRRNTEAYQFTR